MSDAQAGQNAAPMTDARILAIVCYVLMIAAFTNGLTAIIGVVLAYVKRDEVRGTIWQSHFTNMIHTFWISVLFTAALVALAVFGVLGAWQTGATEHFHGTILLLPVMAFAGLACVIWYLYRTVRGLTLAIDAKPYP